MRGTEKKTPHTDLHTQFVCNSIWLWEVKPYEWSVLGSDMTSWVANTVQPAVWEYHADVLSVLELIIKVDVHALFSWSIWFWQSINVSEYLYLLNNSLGDSVGILLFLLIMCSSFLHLIRISNHNKAWKDFVFGLHWRPALAQMDV